MIVSESRKGTDSVKWAKYANKDIIPLWIADTDFRADEHIIKALNERLEHGVFGYGYCTEAFQRAVVEHCWQQYGWKVDPAWICPIPGVVPGINLCRALAIERGKAHGVTLSPVYPHLRHAAGVLHFSQSFSQARDDGEEGWAIDFDDFEHQITDKTGLLLMCHPHNPLGRVFSDDEIACFVDIAKRHDLLVCSDEIHCDLILNGRQHKPFAMFDEDVATRTITLMAASKTFNVAGLTCAFAIIPDELLRQRFIALGKGILGDVNVLGMCATIAAFDKAHMWHEWMIARFEEHAKLVYERINAMPYLSMKPMQATYLAWIDARTLPVEAPQAFFEAAGVGLADGRDYGWEGFLRLNFGCSTNLLEEALDRMAEAVSQLSS